MQQGSGFIGGLQATINEQGATFDQRQQAGKQIGEFGILLLQITA